MYNKYIYITRYNNRYEKDIMNLRRIWRSMWEALEKGKRG